MWYPINISNNDLIMDEVSDHDTSKTEFEALKKQFKFVILRMT